MADLWLLFRPLDALTFRDGRPFSAGVDTLARSTLPRPTTTGGAIRELIGDDVAAIAGPLLWRNGKFLFPTPADVVRKPGAHSPQRLNSMEITNVGVVTNLGLPQLCAGEGDRCGGWIDAQQLQAYLQDGTVPATVYGENEVLRRERRVGLYRRGGRTAEQGFLYSAEYLRPADDLADLGFACRVRLNDGQSAPPGPSLVRLGGEGRQAEVYPITGEFPKPPQDFPDRRLLVYLATPAVFPEGWRLPLDSGVELVRACVEGPEVVTGRGQSTGSLHPVRWAVAPGSVYFLDFTTQANALQFAQQYHGQCLPQTDRRLQTAGFGLCLIGRWR